MESPLQQVTWNCRFRVRKTQEWGKVEMTRKTLPTHACFCNNPFIFFLPTRSTSFSFMEPEPEALLRNCMARDASTTLLDSHDILLNTAVTTCFKMLKLSSPLSVSLVCFSSGICALEFWAEPEQEITGQFWEKKKKSKGSLERRRLIVEMMDGRWVLEKAQISVNGIRSAGFKVLLTSSIKPYLAKIFSALCPQIIRVKKTACVSLDKYQANKMSSVTRINTCCFVFVFQGDHLRRSGQEPRDVSCATDPWNHVQVRRRLW